MKKILGMMVAVLFITSCKKNKREPDQRDVVVLSSPANNSVCITGTVLSESQSRVELKWEKVTNTTGYVVTIKDLITGIPSSFTTNDNQYIATLSRNTPYSWTVGTQAAAAAGTSKTEVWKFYNAGVETVSYAPFPADNLMPGRNHVISLVDGKTTLSWTGSDVDNDIVSYDVYLGTSPSPALLIRHVAEPKLQNVELSTNLTYYWKVITCDRKGNTSESNVVVFIVK